MTTDTNILLSQRSFHIRKSLKDLAQKPRITRRKKEEKQQQPSLPLPSLPPHLNTKDNYVYDVLYECQRGSWLVGYSSKTLLQFDPNPWCDAQMKYTPMNPATYQLPDPTWEWLNKEWLVDMTEDVDEAGWQYAVKFHGAVWHGNYKHFRSFVRRRRWIRLRHCKQQEQEKSISTLTTPRQLIKLDDIIPSSAESSQSLNESNLMENLQKCRLDRERRTVIDSLLSSLSSSQLQSLLQDEKKIMTYMNMFDFEDSKRMLLQKLLDINHNNTYSKPISLSSLSSVERNLIDSLSFYSDIYTILRLDTSSN
ncbi:uncharacterized protein BX664DRAFT_325493 [Halteromyces radiatus]|uniref:uncharacterized protein n=1 Tax=Halteromyces radiatus TaxID=101107 RepID=UPI00221F7779|nr:uncharacterized protein BX664DRAFT_325493 [Halteromyces radiatus]KAI8097060.1 hypothetical protein BX664DRAFT_325493 [Halteromyces radiatus]